MDLSVEEYLKLKKNMQITLRYVQMQSEMDKADRRSSECFREIKKLKEMMENPNAYEIWWECEDKSDCTCYVCEAKIREDSKQS